jgi:signal transduction histidine kinase
MTDSAMYYYQMAYKLAIEHKADYNASFVLASMSLALIKTKDYQQALQYALRSDSLSALIEDWQRVRSLNVLGEAYIKLGNFDKAEAKLREALQVADNSQARVELVYTYKVLYQLDSIRRNYEQALHWHVKYKTLHDSVRFSEEASQFLEMQIYREIKEKDETLHKLQAEQEIKRIEDRNRELIFRIIGVAVLILLVLVFFLLHTQKRLQQKNIELSDKQKDIERINAELAASNQAFQLSTAELAAANKQLKQQNETLAELSREKDGLMGVMAHDLRSPLSGIKSLTNVFRMSDNLDAAQLEYLNLMDLSVKRGTELIDDILLLYERQEKLVSLSISEENLTQLIDKNLHTHRTYAADKRIRLVWDNTVEGTFDTDTKLLLRILDNLLSNALKFTFPGKEVRLITQRNNNNLCMIVADQGQGIDPDEIHKLFRKFSRLRSRPTNGEASTGLGLAIVKQLVDELQGSIEVSSKPGEGTSFTVILPNLKNA